MGILVWCQKGYGIFTVQNVLVDYLESFIGHVFAFMSHRLFQDCGIMRTEGLYTVSGMHLTVGSCCGLGIYQDGKYNK